MSTEKQIKNIASENATILPFKCQDNWHAEINIIPEVENGTTI